MRHLHDSLTVSYPDQFVDTTLHAGKSLISHKHLDKDHIINKVLQTASTVYSRILTPEFAFYATILCTEPHTTRHAV